MYQLIEASSLVFTALLCFGTDAACARYMSYIHMTPIVW
jgi:hypothetical protein